MSDSRETIGRTPTWRETDHAAVQKQLRETTLADYRAAFRREYPKLNVGPALIRAESIARRAHAGQKEIGGGDYILHVERVVAMCVGEQAKAVAWMHDVLEDTPLTASDLLTLGISERIVRAVVCLTRNAERYPEYIHRIKASGDDLALEVKKADLRDHLRPSCPESLLARYERAWHVLAPGVEKPRA